MFSNRLKVKVDEYIGDLNTRFILYYESDNKIFVVKPLGEMVIEEYKGEMVEPTFRLRENEANDFIKAMAELAEKRGILTDKQLTKESKNTGVLESTKYHLEDMRRLVFKEKTK